MYDLGVPKLWNQTIAAHRADVRQAILDSTWELVEGHGVLAVTMSSVAQATGIGRATLYKYFPNVEAILEAHHHQHVTDHLERLQGVAEGPGAPKERLESALSAYAMICHHREQHGTRELSALLHRGAQVVEAERQVEQLFSNLLGEVIETDAIRNDVSADELARYCLHALTAAGTLRSAAAVNRLVAVTMAGLRA